MDKKKILIIAIGLAAITLTINAYAMMGSNGVGNNQGYHMNNYNTGHNGYGRNYNMNDYNNVCNGNNYDEHMNNSGMGYNLDDQGDQLNQSQRYNNRQNDNGAGEFYNRQEYQNKNE